MERRHFLQIPALAAVATMLGAASTSQASRPGKAFKVAAGTDRFNDTLNIMGGQFNVLVSTKDTGGDLCIYHTTRQEKGGPALHVHHDQDEWFYPMSGQFIMQVGDERFTLMPGDSVFAPRGIPHAFAKTNDEEAQMLVLFQPAGTMEEFFHGMAALGKSVPKDWEHALKDLMVQHRMEVVGKPLTF